MGKAAIAETGYPNENTLLKREMDKILDSGNRKANIAKIEQFFKRHLGLKPAKKKAR
jgi:hypothetical protein